MSSPLLVVAALAAEAAYVPSHLPVLVTGAGKVAAGVAVAAELARRSAAGQRTMVLNIGTAGALRPGLSGLFLPSRVINHDISADALALLGAPTVTSIDIPAGDGTVLATGDMFVTDPGVRDRLAQQAHLVDMEGFAVAYACRRAGTPVRIAKHVSDAADESAWEWPQAVQHSARALGRWVSLVAETAESDQSGGTCDPERGMAL